MLCDSLSTDGSTSITIDSTVFVINNLYSNGNSLQLFGADFTVTQNLYLVETSTTRLRFSSSILGDRI